MSKEYFSELARVLQRDNITLGGKTKGGVPILIGEQSIGDQEQDQTSDMQQSFT